VSAVLLGPPSGRWSDRYGRRIVLVSGAAVMAAGYVALLLEPPLVAVGAVRLLGGAGEAAFVVAGFTVAADLAPEGRRGEAVSVATVASYGGLALGPIAADLLIRGPGGFRLAWLVALGCAAVAFVLCASLPDTRPAHDEPPAHGLLPPRPALAPAAVILLVLIGFGGFIAFGGLYARDLGVRPGLAFALFGGVVLVVRGFGRKLPDRLGGRTAATASCVAVGAGLATMALWQEPAGLVAGIVVFAIGQALAYPAVTLLAIGRTRPSERSAAIGAIGAAVDSALGLGAFVLGATAEVAGYDGAFLLAGLVALLGLAVLARLAAAPLSAGSP
jgi:MFS family permease